jgi:predicted ATP-grasp superfamily ATP-dependent carboligase
MSVRGKSAAAMPTGLVQAGALDSYDVLVLDARCKQSLASARSLGRAGLRVALGECRAQCDQSFPVLAFRSRYSARNVVLPDITGDGAEFGAAVVEFVREHPTRVVLPTCDEAVVSMMAQRERLAELECVLALAPNSVLDVTTDKDRTLAVARSLGIEYPKTMRIDNVDDLPTVLGEFGFPFVLKPTTSWTGQTADRIVPEEVVDQAEAFGVAQRFLAAGSGVLAQQWACGRREGVSLFIVEGDVLASCAHVAHRTSPALGGVSVMRESIPMPADIYAAAVSLVTTIGLQGVCEVEFRRDADNRPLLMEINARLAGTIENAVKSGVDFPLMIWQWATGLPIDRVDGYRTGVRTRWLQGDMRWLANNQRRVGRPDSVSRTRALRIFTTEFIRTRHYDCLDRHDMGPALAELRIMATAARRSRGSR